MGKFRKFARKHRKIMIAITVVVILIVAFAGIASAHTTYYGWNNALSVQSGAWPQVNVAHSYDTYNNCYALKFNTRFSWWPNWVNVPVIHSGWYPYCQINPDSFYSMDDSRYDTWRYQGWLQ